MTGSPTRAGIRRSRAGNRPEKFLFSVTFAAGPDNLAAKTPMATVSEFSFPPDPASMPMRGDVWHTILTRAAEHPALLASSCIFILAIAHTFGAGGFRKLSHKLEARDAAAGEEPGFAASVCHFLGEIEAIFGIWALVLFGMLSFWPGIGLKNAAAYIDSQNYNEPIFVVVIMAMAATRPVVAWTGAALGKIAALGKGTPFAWWVVLLTVAPLLGSFITEPAAMTLAGMLLLRRVYAYNPSPGLAYGTLALLFVNISVGGTLTNFAAPPVLMVASPEVWHWTMTDMLAHFGWKAALGIAAATAFYGYLFRREFATLNERVKATDAIAHDRDDTERPPLWICLVHFAFMAWTVEMLLLHHAAMMVAGMLFFLAFTVATSKHQSSISLRGPLLVGFFLAGLVVHGRLQSWWIGPILGSLGKWELFFGATGLTAFNDNAAITYLASQVKALSPFDAEGVRLAGAALATVEAKHYAVLAGAVTGGGLTFIANAPNPAGLAILGRRFDNGVSPLKLFLWAIPPTLILGAAFMLLP